MRSSGAVLKSDGFYGAPDATSRDTLSHPGGFLMLCLTVIKRRRPAGADFWEAPRMRDNPPRDNLSDSGAGAIWLAFPCFHQGES